MWALPWRRPSEHLNESRKKKGGVEVNLCRPHEKAGIKKVAFYVVNKVPMCSDCKEGREIPKPVVDPLQKVTPAVEEPFPVKNIQVKPVEVTTVAKCKCGCGEDALAGREYKWGHKTKGKKKAKPASRARAAAANGSPRKYAAAIADLTAKRDQLTVLIQALEGMESW